MTKRKKTLRKTPAKVSAVRKRSRSTTHVRKQTSEIVKVRRELAEARAQQAATANVLRSISQSTFDLQGVLDSLVKSAAGLCDADRAVLIRKRGEDFYRAALHGFPNEAVAEMKNSPVDLTSGVIAARALRECAIVHVADVNADPDYPGTAAQTLGGVRTTLSVPLVRENEPIGAFTVSRTHVEPFSESHIALIKIFADQAVIAIENVRLLEEVQAKTSDLEESLQQQTATSEVLQIISSSPGELEPVFQKMLENVTRVCGAEFGSMVLVEDDDLVRQAALYNAPAAFVAARINKVFRPHPQGAMATAIRTRQAVHNTDVRTTPPYLERLPYVIEMVELGGARTIVVVPMLRENEAIGAITIYRQEVRPFADKQIEALSNFARQAVIAIENARLLKELRQSLQQADRHRGRTKGHQPLLGRPGEGAEYAGGDRDASLPCRPGLYVPPPR